MTDHELTYGSLFSGIGGIDLGLDRAGLRGLWQCEIDTACAALLERRWPDIPVYDDVREIHGRAACPQRVAARSRGGEHGGVGRRGVDGAAHGRGREREPDGAHRPRAGAEPARRGADHGGRRLPADGGRGQARPGVSSGGGGSADGDCPGCVADVDVLVGGFPCQDVSVAGKRAGLSGARSGLWSEFRRLLAELRPRWLVIENVPGLLSSCGCDQCVAVLPADVRARIDAATAAGDGELAAGILEQADADGIATTRPDHRGRDFALILAGLVELGYGVAWRVLDAQYFGVAQRRRRVFVVGCLGDTGAAATSVLFEPQSCDGDPPPRRQARARAPERAVDGASFSLASAHRGVGQGHNTTHIREVANSLSGVGGGMDYAVGKLLSGQARGGHTGLGVTYAVGEVAVPDIAWALQERDAKGSDSSSTKDGHLIAYALRADAGREGVALTPSPDAEGRVRLRDPGFTVEEERSPTLDASAPPTVAQVPDIAMAINAERDGYNDGSDQTYVVGTLEAGGNRTGGTRPPGSTVDTADSLVPYTPETSPTVSAKWSKGSGGPAGDEHQNLVGYVPDLAATLSADGSSTRGITGQEAHNVVEVSMSHAQRNHPDEEALIPANGGSWGADASTSTTPTLQVGSGVGIPSGPAAVTPTAVRRLTPLECERLQGFPDGWTNGQSDSQRYRQLGNAVCVPVMAWIGARMVTVSNDDAMSTHSEEETR